MHIETIHAAAGGGLTKYFLKSYLEKIFGLIMYVARKIGFDRFDFNFLCDAYIAHNVKYVLHDQ